MAVTATPSDYTQIAQQLYIAYFGRPADLFGLQNMTAALAAANAPTNEADFAASYTTNATVKGIIDNFGNSAESAKLYGTGSDSSFVTAIFQNVLGRDPLIAGLTFWVNAIENGSMTRAQAAENILAGAVTGGSAADKATVTAKFTVANDFTVNIDTTAEVNAYSGAVAAAAARSMLQGVTSTTDASTYAALASSTLSSIVANTVDSTLTLTTGVDSLVGGSGNDVFNASVTDGATAAVATLSTFDKIDGAGGVNTLNIVDTTTHGNAAALAYGAPGATITNIQNVNVTTLNSAGSVGAAFDVSGGSVTNLVVKSGGATGGDYLAGDKTTNITDTTSGTSTITGAANVTVTAGDTVSISHATGAINVTTTGGDIGVAGGTTVNVSTASGDINIGAFGVLNTAGTALTGASAATEATGNIIANDSSTDAHGVVSFGEGSATIFTNGATSVSLTGTFGSTITDVHTAVGSGTAFGTSTLASVTLDGVMGNNTINSDALTSLTILDDDNNIDDADATYTVINTKAHSLALTVGQNLVTNGDSPASAEFANVTDATATAITLATAGTVAVNMELSAAKAVTLTTTQAADTTLNLNSAASLTTITDTGAGALTLTGTVDLGINHKLAMIDASGATGAVTVTLADGTNFAGGAGNDVVTIDGAYASTATGGDGTNTLVFNDTGANWITYTTAGGGAAGVSGFSVLGLTAQAGEGTFNIGGTSFTSVADLAASNGEGAIFTTINGFSTTATVTDVASRGDNFDIGYSANHGSLTINVGADSAAADGTGSSNVEFGVSTHLTGAALAAATTAGGALNGVTSITIHSAGISNAQVAAGGDMSGNTVHLVDDALTSIVITGDSAAAVTYTSVAGEDSHNVSSVTSIDASASTGLVDVHLVAVSDFGGVTIKGGAGLLETIGGAGTDTIITGSGGGIMEAGQGADVINLAASTAAADFLFVAEGESQASGFDVVSGFMNFATKTTAGDASDVLAFGVLTDSGSIGNATAATALGPVATATATGVTNLSYTVNGHGILAFGGSAAASLTVAQAIADALAIMDAAATPTDHFAAFQLGGNTYVLATGHSSADATHDSVVELVGVTGLTSVSTSASSVGGAHTLHLSVGA